MIVIVTLVDKSTHKMDCEGEKMSEVRVWLNLHQSFVNIGDDTIINTIHIIKVKKFQRKQGKASKVKKVTDDAKVHKTHQD